MNNYKAIQTALAVILDYENNDIPSYFLITRSTCEKKTPSIINQQMVDPKSKPRLPENLIDSVTDGSTRRITHRAEIAIFEPYISDGKNIFMSITSFSLNSNDMGKLRSDIQKVKNELTGKTGLHTLEIIPVSDMNDELKTKKAQLGNSPLYVAVENHRLFDTEEKSPLRIKINKIYLPYGTSMPL